MLDRFAHGFRDPSLLGSTLQPNGDVYQVIGIMPPGFSWGRVYGREAEGEHRPRRLAESSVH